MPAALEKKYGVDDLLYLMARLRDPEDGCPWDIKQNYLSITPSTIEEAYEVVDAIEQNDLHHLKEELGDLLFQVIFYAQLAKEEQRWAFDDVVHELTAKLVRRHPHVFPEGRLSSRRAKNAELSDAGIKASWEKIKQQERGAKGKLGLMDDIPRALPAIKRAEKLQKRAAKVGFDWDDPRDVMSKLEEEVAELKAAFESDQPQNEAIGEELGDIIFSCVNLSRHLKLDAEQCARNANTKFESRFKYIEGQLAALDVSLEEASLQQMDELWQLAKQAE